VPLEIALGLTAAARDQRSAEQGRDTRASRGPVTELLPMGLPLGCRAGAPEWFRVCQGSNLDWTFAVDEGVTGTMPHDT